MRRRYLVVLAAALAVAAALAASRAARSPQVPTLTLRPQRLVRTVAAEGVLRPVRSTPINVPAALRQALKIAWIVEDATPVRAGEPVARLDAAEAEKALREGDASLAQADERLAKARTRAEVGREDLGRQAALAGKELDDARSFQTIDTEIYSRFEIATSAIDAELAAHRKAHADAVALARPEVTRSELDLLRIERHRAELERERAVQTLGQLELRAPHDGLVLLNRRWNSLLPRAGDTVFPNEKLAEIPASGAMEAELWVLEADAGGLAIGQALSIRVEGHSEAEIAGRIRQIDAIAQPRQRGTQVQYFGAMAELANAEPTLAKPGVRVAARIVVTDRDEVLVVPRQAVFERNGQKVVHRRSALGGFSTVPVELEAVAPERVVVTAGLAPGDEIALADPDHGSTPRAGTPAGGSPVGGAR